MNWNKWIWRRSNVRTKLNCNEIALAFSHTDTNEGAIVRGTSVEPGVIVLCAPLSFDMSTLKLTELKWKRLANTSQLQVGDVFLGHTYDDSGFDTANVFVSIGQSGAKGLILIMPNKNNDSKTIMKEVIHANEAIFKFIDDYDMSPIIVNAKGNLWDNARRATKALESLIQ